MQPWVIETWQRSWERFSKTVKIYCRFSNNFGKYNVVGLLDNSRLFTFTEKWLFQNDNFVLQADIMTGTDLQMLAQEIRRYKLLS